MRRIVRLQGDGRLIGLQRLIVLLHSQIAGANIGPNRRLFIVGFKDNKFDISGNALAALATHLNGIAGQEASVSFQYGPEGTTSGNRKYTGECFLVSYKESTPVGGLNTFTASFQITGAVTVGTY